MPITIRAIVGRGWGQGAQHSQRLQSVFSHFPGLKVVMPATAYDAKGLLIASVLDDNPVIFIEHRRLYDQKGEVPEKFYTVPLGKALLKRKGKDVTIVAVSQMVQEAEKAADELKASGIEAEVIDLRSVSPLDEDMVFSSAKKTGRVIVADTSWRRCGIASEVASRVCEETFEYLKAPVARVTLPDAPTPTSIELEKHFYPDAQNIVFHAKRLISGKKEKLRRSKKHMLDEGFKGPF